MLQWEDREQFTDALAFADELEEIGASVIAEYNQPKCLHDKENGRYFFKHLKVWEYPFASDWLGKLATKLGKKTLRIMDFGCWLCPFPAYLARRGHEVWGVDDDSWGHIKRCNVTKHYPGVHWFIDDVRKLDVTGFDAVISCSVLEHIEPKLRIELLRHLKGMLQPNGKQMHLVDYYFPEKKKRDHQRMNFYDVATQMGWKVPDLSMCPGAPGFNFESLREGLKFVRPQYSEGRIAVGDDL